MKLNRRDDKDDRKQHNKAVLGKARYMPPPMGVPRKLRDRSKYSGKGKAK